MQTKSKILLARPEAMGDLLSLSCSKVKTFDSCRKKFYFSYIEKMPKKDWEHLKLGKFLHEIVENFFKRRMEGDTSPLNKLMTECWKSSLENWKDQISQETKKSCYDMIAGYLKKLQAEEKANALPNVTGVETAFHISIDEKVLLIGFIDRVQKDPDGLVHVADYKTSKDKKYLKNDFFQLLTYAYVMCLMDPTLEEVRTSYIMMRHNFEEITKVFSKKEIMSIEDQFLEYAEAIQQEKLYRASPSPLCSYCDFVEFCEEGQEKTGYISEKSLGVSDW